MKYIYIYIYIFEIGYVLSTTYRSCLVIACFLLLCTVYVVSPFVQSLRVNLSRLIAYAESADISLQREVGMA